jgi:hypothetical protein
MIRSIEDIPKKRGRKPAGGRNAGVMVRIPPDQLARLDAWIATLPDPKPTRPEAIRRALERQTSAQPGPKSFKAPPAPKAAGRKKAGAAKAAE